jgi:hypothetical protein
MSGTRSVVVRLLSSEAANVKRTSPSSSDWRWTFAGKVGTTGGENVGRPRSVSDAEVRTVSGSGRPG